MSGTQVTPEVLWAQRSSKEDATKNYIYLTISVPDVPPKAMKLDLKPTSLNFTGTSETKKTTYHLAIDFFAEIDVDESKTHHTARDIEMVLRKKELKEEYWPRLLKDKAKVHYLKTDFDKWVDEDEQNAAADDDYMNNFGGGMGGDGDGGFGGIDFSKLGGGGAVPGADDLDAEAEGEGDDEEDDDEMPDLENEDKAEEVEGKGKGKA
ncbi:MAG: hypothetical protein Q9227_007676 [Pyrenula ochraceoflavens]